MQVSTERICVAPWRWGRRRPPQRAQPPIRRAPRCSQIGVDGVQLELYNSSMVGDDSGVKIDDLRLQRIKRGLTQVDLARLMGVSQQAIAKWEQSCLLPRSRLEALAKVMREPAAALLSVVDASGPERESRVRASVAEMFAPQVVVDFKSRSFHYTPTTEEAADFWLAVQGRGFAHLSAGPVQVLINTKTMLRLDVSEDPPLSSFEPYPIHPSDEEDDGDEREDGERHWFDRDEARIFIRDVKEPYTAVQRFFSEFNDKDAPSEAELADLHVGFQSQRDDEHSIFDLFEHTVFQTDAGVWVTEPDGELHPDALRVFYSEDYDGVPQHTWVHNRDIEIVEVPTRLWALHEMSISAWAKVSAADRDEPRARSKRAKRGSKRKRRA
jgi:transcriptional regulator with XRE-family HTH domain